MAGSSPALPLNQPWIFREMNTASKRGETIPGSVCSGSRGRHSILPTQSRPHTPSKGRRARRCRSEAGAGLAHTGALRLRSRSAPPAGLPGRRRLSRNPQIQTGVRGRTADRTREKGKKGSWANSPTSSVKLLLLNYCGTRFLSEKSKRRLFSLSDTSGAWT